MNTPRIHEAMDFYSEIVPQWEALEADRNRLREELRIREESQIPVIPKGAQDKITGLEAEVEQLREKVTRYERMLYPQTHEQADIVRAPFGKLR